MIVITHKFITAVMFESCMYINANIMDCTVILKHCVLVYVRTVLCWTDMIVQFHLVARIMIRFYDARIVIDL